ncbi:MAG TPA: peroxidase family protein [Chthoniobacterales bacterium]|nr:peroxidase family protein [Chthoniobacterales bacterium]
MPSPEEERAPRPPRCSHAGSIQAAPKGYYSRRFNEPAEPLGPDDEWKLVELGKAMRYGREREGTLTPRIGYTYFGQFLGHDLTHDATPLGGPYADPEKTPNFRTAVFDLDHVYADGPAGSPYLYEGEEGAETFRVGATVPGGYRRDLPVRRGHLLIGDLQDTRNVDNLLLRQLHVLFLKFHNEAVRQLQTNADLQALGDSLGHGSVFEQARRLVCWHYQWIIRHDYLPRILHNDVWHHQEPRSVRPGGSDFSVPIEFSLAAFRFGHSMVRNAYRLNCRRQRVRIDELMTLGQKAEPISDDDLVEWGTFFDGLPTSGPPASSAFIDTSVSLAMHGLSAETIRLANRSEPIDPSNLPVRTLLRGARAKLPSGQEAAEALAAEGKIAANDCLTSSQLTADRCNASGSVLRSARLERNTPLFYYILKEAELKGDGLTLGPLGSHVVSEAIQNALEADPNGYMAIAGPDWELPRWHFPSGSRRPVNSLIGIVRLIGDEKLLPECEAHWRSLQLPAIPV